MAALAALTPETTQASSELGTRGDVAFLRLASPAAPGRWAVVSTPGDRWFSVEVDGGFCLDHFEEDTLDDEARALLARYVDYAMQYLSGKGVAVRRSRLGLPELVLDSEKGTVKLRRSVSRTIRDLARHATGRR